MESFSSTGYRKVAYSRGVRTSRWSELTERYRADIQSGRLSPGDKLPSDAALAEAHGVSRATAHKALHELQRMGLVTRQPRWGTVVAEPKAKGALKVVLMVDRFAPAVNFPSSEMLRGIADGLGEETEIVIVDSRGDPTLEARRLHDLGDVDGLLLWPTTASTSAPILQRLVDGGLPVVVLDRIPKGLRADLVASDNVGATLAALHALEARGHRRIGFLSFHIPGLSSIRERHGAYVAALEEVGLKDHAPYERWFARELDGDTHRLFQAVSDALLGLTHGPNAVTALFCVQDVFAAATLEASMRLGIDLPLAAFNDWPVAMLRTPPGTLRIVQRTHEIGHRAAQLLLDRIGGARPEPRLVRVPAELLVPGVGRPVPPTPLYRPTEATPQ